MRPRAGAPARLVPAVTSTPGFDSPQRSLPLARPPVVTTVSCSPGHPHPLLDPLTPRARQAGAGSTAPEAARMAARPHACPLPSSTPYLQPNVHAPCRTPCLTPPALPRPRRRPHGSQPAAAAAAQGAALLPRPAAPRRWGAGLADRMARCRAPCAPSHHADGCCACARAVANRVGGASVPDTGPGEASGAKAKQGGTRASCRGRGARRGGGRGSCGGQRWGASSRRAELAPAPGRHKGTLLCATPIRPPTLCSLNHCHSLHAQPGDHRGLASHCVDSRSRTASSLECCI